MCNDYRGTDRFIYYLASATSFWRFDVVASTWLQLASPPSGTVGGGTVICFDPSRGTKGYVWALISDGTATVTWQYYDVATNTWTARSIALQQGGSVPAFGTVAALTHTCSTYNAAGNDDFIYAATTAGTTFYRYSIANNVWYNSASTPAITAPGAGAGTGGTLLWMPGWDTDRIVQIRGGGTSTMSYYSILNNNWTGITYYPSTTTFTTNSGTASWGMDSDKILIHENSTFRVHYLDLSESFVYSTATAFPYVSAHSTARSGNRTVYVKDAITGTEFVYVGASNLQSWQRLVLIG